jgi:hypothetical protein
MGEAAGHPFRGNQWTTARDALGTGPERAVYTDRSGKLVSDVVTGTEETVDRPVHAGDRDPKSDLVHHHTHPYDAPFSGPDLAATAERRGVKSMVVHTPGGTYEAEILDHEQLRRKATDAFRDAGVRSVDSYLEGKPRGTSRQDRYKIEATEALDELQGLGLIKWRKL